MTFAPTFMLSARLSDKMLACLRELDFSLREENEAVYVFTTPTSWLLELTADGRFCQDGEYYTYNLYLSLKVMIPDVSGSADPISNTKITLLWLGDAEDELRNYLRVIGYPVEAIVRPKRLRALIE